MEWLSVITVWHWLSLACILAAFDVLVGANFFLMLIGASALIVAITMALVKALSTEYQLLLFAVMSILGFMFWYKVLNKTAVPLDLELNNRAHSYVGRVFEVEDAIVHGRGKIRIGDTVWLASATSDIAVGVKVRVIDADGVILKVEPV